LIWIKRQRAIPGSMHIANARRRAVTDFCLSPQTYERIVRQTELMDRMIARLGIEPDACDRGDASTLWCEARFRCIGCKWSPHCARVLATPPRLGSLPVPDFCANANFFQHCTGENSTTIDRQGGSP
jgi:hypothetical protein